MHDNPSKALSAIADVRGFTLGHYALLEMIDSPVIDLHCPTYIDAAIALWVVEQPAVDAAEHIATALPRAVKMMELRAPDELIAAAAQLIDTIEEFLKLLPRPEASQKKSDSVTDGSPN